MTAVHRGGGGGGAQTDEGTVKAERKRDRHREQGGIDRQTDSAQSER